MKLSKPDSRFVAFVVVMSALSNVLGLLVIPAGVVTFHLIQLPIVFSGLAAGAMAGGVVGLLGTFVMAFTLPRPIPYLIVGNGILGFLIGALHSKMRHLSKRAIVPQVISVFLAYLIQMPYVYATDVYLMGMPHAVVMAIMGALLIEDMISAVVSHVILHRIDISALFR